MDVRNCCVLNDLLDSCFYLFWVCGLSYDRLPVESLVVLVKLCALLPHKGSGLLLDAHGTVEAPINHNRLTTSEFQAISCLSGLSLLRQCLDSGSALVLQLINEPVLARNNVSVQAAYVPFIVAGVVARVEVRLVLCLV